MERANCCPIRRNPVAIASKGLRRIGQQFCYKSDATAKNQSVTHVMIPYQGACASMNYYPQEFRFSAQTFSSPHPQAGWKRCPTLVKPYSPTKCSISSRDTVKTSMSDFTAPRLTRQSV